MVRGWTRGPDWPSGSPGRSKWRRWIASLGAYCFWGELATGWERTRVPQESDNAVMGAVCFVCCIPACRPKPAASEPRWGQSKKLDQFGRLPGVDWFCDLVRTTDRKYARLPGRGEPRRHCGSGCVEPTQRSKRMLKNTLDRLSSGAKAHSF
jgi:hypothetical protein